MKLIEFTVKMMAALLLLVSVFVAVIWVGIETSGKHTLLSKVGRISRSGDALLLDVPPAERTWIILIALSKSDLARMRQIDGWMEIAVEGSEGDRVHLTTKTEAESGFSSEYLKSNERRVIFNGLASDYLANYKYDIFMDDIYYTDSEYDSFFLMKGEFVKGARLKLLISCSDDVILGSQAIVFGVIPKDSI